MRTRIQNLAPQGIQRLSTAYEGRTIVEKSTISRVTETADSIDVSTQDDDIQAVLFNPNETQMYVLGNQNDSIYIYDMCPAGVLATGAYSSAVDISTQCTSPLDMAFNEDGSELYVLCSTGYIYVYDLDPVYDVSTASHNSSPIDLSGIVTDPVGIVIDTNGVLLIIDAAGSISTIGDGAVDIDGSSSDTSSSALTGQELYPHAMSFSYDGSKLYLLGTNMNKVYQYTLSTPWDLSTIAYASKESAILPGGTKSFISITKDGTRLFFHGLTSDLLYEYILSTPWDISTASANSSITSVPWANLVGACFNDTGTKMVILMVYAATGHRFREYTLSTPWDLSSASFVQESANYSGVFSTPKGLWMNSIGTKAFVLTATNDSIHQFTFGTGFDASTVSSDGLSFSVTAEDTYTGSIWLNPSMSKLYYLGTGTYQIFSYDVGTSFGVTSSINVSANITTPSSLSLDASGTVLVSVDTNNDSLIEFRTPSTGNVGDITYSTDLDPSTTTGIKDMEFVEGNDITICDGYNSTITRWSFL